MAKFIFVTKAISVVCVVASLVHAQKSDRVVLEHADHLEIVLVDGKYITNAVGNVIFQTETGRIACDSAVWRECGQP